MILVVGATGMLGTEICRLLSDRGKQVKALVRPTSDQGRVGRLRALGCEIAVGDLRDRSSLEAACREAGTIITTASSMPFGYVPDVNTPQLTDRDGYLSLIGAARRAGVERFVYTSFSCPGPAHPLQDAKRGVEEGLRSSGLEYTILRPTFFMELWLSPAVGFDYANRKASIYGEGSNRISWISFKDVAQFAVATLNNSAARDATIALGGPQALGPLAVVGIFEQVGSKPFEVSHVPVQALEGQLAAATDPMQQSFPGLMLSYAGGDEIDMHETLKTYPIRMTPVEEYARQAYAQVETQQV